MLNIYETYSKEELVARVEELEQDVIDFSEMYLDLYHECYGETMEDTIDKVMTEYEIDTDFKGNIVDGKLSIERQILELDDD